jgi:hypothetical protein
MYKKNMVDAGGFEARICSNGTGNRKQILNFVLELDNGKCHICQKPYSSDQLQIDHDHASTCCRKDSYCLECIRGLLCGNCNRGLGLFEDNPEFLEEACLYLAHWRERR